MVAFWLGLCLVAYAYLGYPLLIAGAAALRRRSSVAGPPFTGSISIVVAMHNEESSIERRVRELEALLTSVPNPGELLLVSDGSTDGTVALARALCNDRIRLLELTRNVGKAEALSRGCAAARGELLVFADARQRWDAEALRSLLRNFSDPEVGAVSGELVIESTGGVGDGVGLYWQLEKWLRLNEGRLHSTVGVSGAIAAVRRALFRPIPAGTLLDDVYWPMRVVMRGHRVVHEPGAVARDRLPPQAQDEFRRKVRTLAGNFQLLVLLPELLLPWRNPIWWQFISHKLLRLAAPWALLVVLGSSLLLARHSPFFILASVLQLLGYGLGLAALLGGSRVRGRLAAAAGSFLLLNAAAWMAFWVWVSGGAGRSWGKARYSTAP